MVIETLHHPPGASREPRRNGGLWCEIRGPGAGAREPRPLRARVQAGDRWLRGADFTVSGAVARDPHSGLVAVADARIDNRRELVKALDAAPGGSDAALILAAYRSWGTAAADRLVGDFAFVVWDPRDRLVLGARDPSGVRPLYFRSERGRFLASSVPGPLARGGPVSLDGYAVADFLCLAARPSSRTVLAEVRKVPPGYLLRIDLLERDGPRLRRFWCPAARERSGVDDEEWSRRFRAVLSRAVEDRIAGADGAVAVLTSGGLDSSAVAGLGQRSLRSSRRSGPLVAYSHVFPTWAQCDESAYGRLLARELGIEHHELSAEREVLPLDPGPPPDLAEIEPWAALYEASGGVALDRAAERGCSLVLTGFGGDCLFDAARFRYWDDVRAGRWWRLAPWLGAARDRGASPAALAWSFLVKPLLPWGVRHRLDALRPASNLRHPPPWLGAGFRRRTRPGERLRRRLEAPPGLGVIARSRYRQILELGMQSWSIESWSALAARRGLGVGHPLLDRRVLDLVLESPVRLGSRPGPAGTKWLLRRSLRGVVPEPVLERPDKGSWGPYLAHRMREDRGRIAQVVHGGVLGELGILDPRPYESGLEALGGETRRSRGLLTFLPPLLMELWLAAGRLDVTGVSYPEPMESGDCSAWTT